jgi:hypothetical protein
MRICSPGSATGAYLDEEARRFYRNALSHLSASSIPFLVGGAFAYERRMNLECETKDLDVFLLEKDVPRALTIFDDAGCRGEVAFPHWLAKVYCGDYFIDLIFSSGNGVARVDEEWFQHAEESEVLGERVRLCPLEETIWSKAFIQERERFDGADVLHLIRQFGPELDWSRLLQRFGPHWPVLFGHIVMFGFVYPGMRHRIPYWVLDELLRRYVGGSGDYEGRLCNGTLLSREQYLYDVQHQGYRDGRLDPKPFMTAEEVEIWTAAIGKGARDG